MDFEVKIAKNNENNASKNNVFFDCILLLILGGFEEGLGRVWEGFGEGLGFGILFGRALGPS